eukprot:2361359-Amphidinium_carterae.1
MARQTEAEREPLVHRVLCVFRGQVERKRPLGPRDRVLCTLGDEVESRERSEQTLGVGCTSAALEGEQREGEQ